MKIEEFASRIGTSVSTVSKALNGYSDVSEETRRHVVSSARRLGYTPSPLGGRLRRNATDAIGFVVSPPQTGFAHPYFLNMMMGIDEGLAGTKFHLIITAARQPDRELDSFKRLVEVQGVDAMIFSRTWRKDSRIAYLQRRGVPFATLGRSETGKPFPYVDLDYAFVGQEGCRRLRAFGHRRIGLINSPTHLMFSHLKRIGYERGLREAGLPVDPALYAEHEISEEGGARGATAMMALPDPPTAMLFGHDLMAIGAMRALAALGKRPGRDVSIIGNDDHPVGAFSDPPLTTFSAQTKSAGQRIVDLLLRHMAGAPARDLQEVWVPSLIARASDGPRRIRRGQRR